MLKAIFAKHVQAGDEILASGGDRIGVHHIEVDGAIVRIYVDNSFYRNFGEYDVVGLGHQPLTGRSPGIAQELLMRDIEGRCAAITVLGGLGDTRVLEGAFTELLKQLVTYELGKPEVKS